jgi:hypothetical protein
VIGRVEARAFKNDAHGEEDLPQFQLPTFRTFLLERIIEVLLTIELDTAVIAPVRVNRHADLS